MAIRHLNFREFIISRRNSVSTRCQGVPRPSRKLVALGYPPGASSNVARAPTVVEDKVEVLEANEHCCETESLDGSRGLWDSVPSRTKLVLACSLGFCLANIDKTNFTLAVLPMGLENGWTPTMIGIVQSAFFYGFLAMQVPGGILSTKFGGVRTLPRGVGLFSLATACIPLVASNLPALCILRSITGLGEAMAPSAIVDIISRSVPPAQRASSVSFAFAGLHIGSIFGLLLSPFIISVAGWPSLFYLIGLGGIGWCIMFSRLVTDLKISDPGLEANLHLKSSLWPRYKRDSPLIDHEILPSTRLNVLRQLKQHPLLAGSSPIASLTKPSRQIQGQQQPSIPYRAFLRSQPVQVLMLTHFCHNWFHYTMLAWLPTYFSSTLSLDLTHAAHTALLPPMAGVVASAAAGFLGDLLIRKGVPTPIVRKMAQSLAFVVPTALLATAAFLSEDPEQSALAVPYITGALGISSFSLAGLYCTHQDISPRYSSALLGLTNVAGSVPGIIGVAMVGLLYDHTGSWSAALFLPSAAFLLAGAAAYTMKSQHEPIDFDQEDNSPFIWERRLSRRLRAWATPLGLLKLPRFFSGSR